MPSFAGTSADAAAGTAACTAEAGTAVVLVNTGTPDAPRTGAVRAFLRRFLSDTRVVELPRALWLPLLYGVVLPLRAPRSAHKYRMIWRDDGASPLSHFSERLRLALSKELAPHGGIQVLHAFLYSRPLIETVMDTLRRSGVRRLAVLPLFPQASGSTTGAVFDQIGRALGSWRAPPELRVIASYHNDPAYIGALAAAVNAHWARQGREGHLLMSFHGVPQAYVSRGDRYADQCHSTALLLAAALNLAPQEWSLTFQSRFGANRWLTPATDRTLRELPRRGIRAVSVVCPGFAADCLETLEEIAITGRGQFLAAGGERFEYISALNDDAEHVRALAGLLRHCGAGWF